MNNTHPHSFFANKPGSMLIRSQDCPVERETISSFPSIIQPYNNRFIVMITKHIIIT